MTQHIGKTWGALLVIISIIITLLVVKRTDDTNVFHRFLARHAEETAVNCGIIPVEANPEPGYACALEAQQAGKGFFLQVQKQGIDSKIADGWAATQNGNVLFFHYDSDPSGGSRTGTIIYQRTCVNPELNGKQIACNDFESTIRIPLSFRDKLRKNDQNRSNRSFNTPSIP